MQILLSITGLFKMLLMLVGIFVILRVFRQIMQSKSDVESRNKQAEQDRLFENEKQQKLKNVGKTNIVRPSQIRDDIHDIDFEEVKE